MKNNTLCNRHSLGVNNHTKMYVTYTHIYGWSDYGGESSYQPRYRLENMMWMTLLVYDYIIPGGTTMEHIIALFILALCFFSFFYFLYHVLVKLQNKENFSDEYKLMVASCVVFVFILLF